MTTRLDRLENELLEMKGNQKKNEGKLEGLEHDFKNTKDRMRLVDNDIIPDINGKMDHKLDRLSQKLKLMEIHDRRMNLLFYGVEQKPNENVYEQLRKCVKLISGSQRKMPTPSKWPMLIACQEKD